MITVSWLPAPMAASIGQILVVGGRRPTRPELSDPPVAGPSAYPNPPYAAPQSDVQARPQHVWTHVIPLGQSLWPLGHGVTPQYGGGLNATRARHWQIAPLSGEVSWQAQLLLPMHAGGVQFGEQVCPGSQGLIGVAAKAVVRILVMIGAVQATAAPAPIRFSIFLLEMLFLGSSLGSMSHPLPRSRRSPFVELSVSRSLAPLHHAVGGHFLRVSMNLLRPGSTP